MAIMIALLAVIAFVIALVEHHSNDYVTWGLLGLLFVSVALLWPWYPGNWRYPRR